MPPRLGGEPRLGGDPLRTGDFSPPPRLQVPPPSRSAGASRPKSLLGGEPRLGGDPRLGGEPLLSPKSLPPPLGARSSPPLPPLGSSLGAPPGTPGNTNMSGLRVISTRLTSSVTRCTWGGARGLATTGGPGRSGHEEGQEGPNGGYRAALALATATALALKAYNDRERMFVKADNEVVAHENRVRIFMTPDKMFNYFASYQITGSTGRKEIMMTPLDFYAAITPDCTLIQGVGAGIAVDITDEEIKKNSYYKPNSPVVGSTLNKIGDLGLLSYSDFCFLLTLLSTPVRYIDTAFNLFDVTGDGKIEAKEFAYVSTKMAHKTGGFGSYTNMDQDEILASSSGLLNYLFGKERKGVVTREDFRNLQSDLLDEIIQLEFSEYDKEGR